METGNSVVKAWEGGKIRGGGAGGREQARRSQ